MNPNEKENQKEMETDFNIENIENDDINRLSMLLGSEMNLVKNTESIQSGDEKNSENLNNNLKINYSKAICNVVDENLKGESVQPEKEKITN